METTFIPIGKKPEVLNTSDFFMFKETNLEKKIITVKTQIIGNAYYLTIVANLKQKLTKAIEKKDREATKLGLEISEEKTKYMKVRREDVRVRRQIFKNTEIHI